MSTTTFPIFRSDQVLSSTNLNHLIEFFDREGRNTRRSALGIGIVCGLEPQYDDSSQQITIGKGSAITSEGHLIELPTVTLSTFRAYEPRELLEEDDSPEEIEGMATIEDPSAYPFFRRANNTRIRPFELLEEGADIEPGSPAPRRIDDNFARDKVLLLFLETNADLLRNCDLNDCTDRGLLAEFTTRILAIPRADADDLLSREAGAATGPVDRRNHPRHDLEPLRMPKLALAQNDVATYPELFARIGRCVAQVLPRLVTSLQESYTAYEYLLADMYPPETFPDGPFGNLQFVRAIADDFGKNVFMTQYLYDVFSDLVASHNEFLDAASELNAECVPALGRFPKHVLLGELSPAEAAAAPDRRPLSVNSNAGSPLRPAAFRHHFVPSPLGGVDARRLEEIRALHYRTYLIAHRARFSDLMEQPIRITPSRAGGQPLSERAIPFYYEFAAEDDLHRNWSPQNARRNRLSRTYSHRLINGAHPLEERVDEADFFRVEGVVGKNLSEAMRDLARQKRELGLSFAVEPVYVRSDTRGEVLSTALDRQAQLRGREALLRLLDCKLDDLDVAFQMVMLLLFSHLLRVSAGLAKTKTDGLVKVRPFEVGFAIDPTFIAVPTIPNLDDGPADDQDDDDSGGGAAGGGGAAAGGAVGGGRPAVTDPFVVATPPRPLAGNTVITGSNLLGLLGQPVVAAGGIAARGNVTTGGRATVRGTRGTGGRGLTRPQALENEAANVLSLDPIERRILGGSPILVSAVSEFASLSHTAKFNEAQGRSSKIFKTLQGTNFNKGDLTNRIVSSGGFDTRNTVALAFADILKKNPSTSLFDRVKDFVITVPGDDSREDKARNLFPTINLLDKTEDLVDVVRAPDLAHFDFDKFESRYGAFVEAYDAYIRWADQADNKGDQNLAESQAEVIAAYTQIAGAGIRTGVQSLADEFETRVTQVHSELLLQAYAKKHPGLEHCGGVGKGQTLVLLYAHKSILGQLLGEQQQGLTREARRTFVLNGIDSSTLTIRDPRDIFRPRAPQPDPLEDFVVIGDLCVPYHCCDADCSDIDTKPPILIERRPRTVRGRVFGEQQNANTVRVLKSARVAVRNMDTSNQIAVDVSEGQYSFQAVPGATYEIEVKNPTFVTVRRFATASEKDEHVDLDFTLRKKT